MSNSSYGTGSGAPPPPAGRPPLHADTSNGSYRDDISEASDPRYRPSAAPPAGAPPTPPPTPPSWNAKTTTNNFRADYGTQGGSTGNNDTASSRISFRGDATLRPNIGLTNSYEYALFGWTLQELIKNLRTVNLIASSLTLLWIMFSWTWLGNLLTLKLSRVVLLGYLAVLSLALFLVDIMGFYRTHLSDRGIMTGSTHMEERVRDQLGLLYHPGGKALYIFFLAVLCVSLGEIMLRGVALLYCFSVFGYVYAYNTYPEFRREEAPQASASGGARSFWNKQAWTTTSLNSRGLAEAAARNWSSRWGIGSGPEEEPGETDSFLRHNQANQNYVYV